HANHAVSRNKRGEVRFIETVDIGWRLRDHNIAAISSRVAHFNLSLLGDLKPKVLSEEAPGFAYGARTKLYVLVPRWRNAKHRHRIARTQGADDDVLETGLVGDGNELCRCGAVTRVEAEVRKECSLSIIKQTLFKVRLFPSARNEAWANRFRCLWVCKSFDSFNG
ncbi:MAG: hypothetical protein AAF571_13165, partial [Verrucomicrobiota bacterium]